MNFSQVSLENEMKKFLKQGVECKVVLRSASKGADMILRMVYGINGENIKVLNIPINEN